LLQQSPYARAVRWEGLDSSATVGAVLDGLAARKARSSWSPARRKSHSAGFSILACRPLEVLCLWMANSSIPAAGDWPAAATDFGANYRAHSHA